MYFTDLKFNFTQRGGIKKNMEVKNKSGIEIINDMPDMSRMEYKMNALNDCIQDLKIVQLELLDKVTSMEKLISKYNQVNKKGLPRLKAGRKRCAMFYEKQSIEDSDLVHLIKVMGLTSSQILKDFVYENEEKQIVSDKVRCRNFLNNRLRKLREEGLI